MTPLHTPVLLAESCDLLVTSPDGYYFDATLGFGGHTAEILRRLSPEGIVIASDVDETAFSASQQRFSGDPRARLYRFNFTNIDIALKFESLHAIHGVLADLGVSSYQLDDPTAGISFRSNARLDMRLDKTLPLTAEELVNTFSEEEIADIIFSYGEDRNARKIARKIVEMRAQKRLKTAEDLVGVVEKLVPPNFVNKTMARVFQSFRIYINDELGKLQLFLEKSLSVLQPGGRLVVIAYHSLEDRVVKEFIKQQTNPCTCPADFPICTCGKQPTMKAVTRKAITPGAAELNLNYRSRSAKLRAAEKI